MYVIKESSEAAKGLAIPKSPQFETNVLDSGGGGADELGGTFSSTHGRWLPSYLCCHLCRVKHNNLSPPTQEHRAKYKAQSVRFPGSLQLSFVVQFEE